jgi:imidazolonepropionase-like amidohydrolase
VVSVSRGFSAALIACAAPVLGCATAARAAAAVAQAEAGTGPGAAAAAAGQLSPPEPVTAIRVSRLLTMDAEHRVFQPGQLLVRAGRIESVGPPTELPPGAALVELEGWAVPGMVDLHSHVVSDGWGDLNDMVLATNPEFSIAAAIRPSNRQLQLACASGVTTLFLIPGSGTAIGGAGVLFKSKTDATFDDCVLANPGGLKVAQAYNPERRSGDLGLTRAGLSWLIDRANREALAARAAGRSDPRLETLAKVLAKELPVLVHTAGSEGVGNTGRMWRETFDTNSVLSHGDFDGYRVAEYIASLGMPVNHGPRTFDTYSRDGLVGTAVHFSAAPLFSLNTDAPVIPAHELFLQGSMCARQGLDSYAMLRALTIHPALAFGIGERVGSLEVGKDADVVVFSGDPLDPRSRVEQVWIDGRSQYRRSDGEQWF